MVFRSAEFHHFKPVYASVLSDTASHVVSTLWYHLMFWMMTTLMGPAAPQIISPLKPGIYWLAVKQLADKKNVLFVVPKSSNYLPSVGCCFPPRCFKRLVLTIWITTINGTPVSRRYNWIEKSKWINSPVGPAHYCVLRVHPGFRAEQQIWSLPPTVSTPHGCKEVWDTGIIWIHNSGAYALNVADYPVHTPNKVFCLSGSALVVSKITPSFTHSL